VNSLSVGVSALAHAAAIGALLTLKPVPLLAPIREVIEVSLVLEQVPGGPRPNDLSGAISGDSPVDVSAVPSLIRPDVTATAPSPNWPGSVNAGHLFDVPVLPTFKPQMQSLASDTLGTMLDCLVIEGSARGASRHARRARPPCVAADLPPRFAVTLPTNVPEPRESGVRADDDYRTFKPDRSLVHDDTLAGLLFPDNVPQANRALKKWFGGLFH
jgi:hypothetical protein